MVRILMVSGTLPPGLCGVGDYSTKLVGALASLDNVRVGVLTSDTSCQLSPKVDVVQFLGSWSWLSAFSIRKAVTAWQPDIIHVQYPSQGFIRSGFAQLLPLLFKQFGFRVVVTMHEPYRWPSAWKLFFGEVVA
jgi:hypothetical protein